MSRREKLIAKMRSSSGNIRFNEVDALLRHEGFVLFNQRGSHLTYHRADGRLLSIVVPHGGRNTAIPLTSAVCSRCWDDDLFAS